MVIGPQVARTNATIRTVARVAGVLLLAVAVVLAWRGIADFPSGEELGSAADHGTRAVLELAGAGFALVLGLGLLNVGFLRAQAEYVAGEASPALRSVRRDLLGRPGAAGEERGGPFCTACGERNDAAARFCDACGTPLTSA